MTINNNNNDDLDSLRPSDDDSQEFYNNSNQNYYDSNYNDESDENDKDDDNLNDDSDDNSNNNSDNDELANEQNDDASNSNDSENSQNSNEDSSDSANSDKNSDNNSKSNEDSDDLKSNEDNDSTDINNSDSDNESNKNDDTKDNDQAGQNDNGENKHGLKSLKDKINKKNPKKKFKDFVNKLKGKQKKNNNDPRERTKNLIEKTIKAIKRVMQLLKLYAKAMRLFMLYKMWLIIQKIIAFLMKLFSAIWSFITSVFSAIFNFFAGIFTTAFSFIAGVAGTVAAVISSIVVGAITIVGLVVGFLAWMNQLQQQRDYSQFYDECVRQVQTSKSSSDDASSSSGGGSQVGGGMLSLGKKGSKQYKNAKAIFDFWVKHGTSGAAAAGVVGYVSGEGGFDIPDRAQGHTTFTKSDSIANGADPTAAGGGGGPYQFTPFSDYAKVGSKKWLDLAGQSKWMLQHKIPGWNSAYDKSGKAPTFVKFGQLTDPEEACIAWDAAEIGVESNYPQRKAVAKAAYNAFNGSKYDANVSKLKKAVSGAGGAVTDTGSKSSGSTTSSADDASKDADCAKILKKTDDDDDASIKAGGMTYSQAKKFMLKWYHTSITPADFPGAASGDPDIHDNCTTWSQYFIHHYTKLKNGAGNGGEVVSQLVAANSGKIKTSYTPEAYSVFSIKPNEGHFNNIAKGSAGHTGIVLGIDKKKKVAIVGEGMYGWHFTKIDQMTSGVNSIEIPLKVMTKANGWSFVHLNKFMKKNIK